MRSKNTNPTTGRGARQISEAWNTSIDSSNRQQKQFKSPRAAFARDIARTCGPRLAQPGWHHIACVLARKPQDDTALSAAMRRALEERGRA